MSTRAFTLEEVLAVCSDAAFLSADLVAKIRTALLYATPEAKTWSCGMHCSDECKERGHSIAPVAPPPWLPLGQNPSGACKDWCGRETCRHDDGNCPWQHPCTPYCAARAKAQRDAAQGAARAIADLPVDPVAEKAAEDAVKRSQLVPTRRPLAPMQPGEKLSRLEDYLRTLSRGGAPPGECSSSWAANIDKERDDLRAQLAKATRLYDERHGELLKARHQLTARDAMIEELERSRSRVELCLQEERRCYENQRNLVATRDAEIERLKRTISNCLSILRAVESD